MGERITTIPNHESGVRKIIAENNGTNYKAFNNFNEAKNSSKSYMIMEGDYGGQIYLSIPVKLIKCDYKDLEKLLEKIDLWRESDGSKIYFEEFEIGQGVPGGMGGGLATDKLWLHKKLEKQRHEIQSFLDGKTENIQKKGFFAKLFKA